MVASLYQVTSEHSKIWRGTLSIDACIERWARDVKISLSYAEHPDHCLTRYERLVLDPYQILRNVCKHLDVPFTPRMLTNRSMSSSKLNFVLSTESWKRKVDAPIRNANSRKFYTVFDRKQQQYILGGISSLKIELQKRKVRLVV